MLTLGIHSTYCDGIYAVGVAIEVALVSAAGSVAASENKYRAFTPPTILDAILGMQEQYFDALPHQHTSLAQIQHRLDLSGMPLFNSIISVQNDVSDQPYAESLAFKSIEEDDPTDVSSPPALPNTSLKKID